MNPAVNDIQLKKKHLCKIILENSREEMNINNFKNFIPPCILNQDDLFVLA